MTLKLRYIIYSVILHGVITYLLYLLLQENKGYFIAAEILILISFLVSIWLLQGFTRPIRLMQSGVNAIQDKDFNIKFVETGSSDMDQLVRVYNTMIDNIRKERTQLEEQHYFLQKMIQASPSGIAILDYDGKHAELNPMARKMLGLQEKIAGAEPEAGEHPILDRIKDLEPGQSEVISGKGAEKFKCEASHFIHRGFHRKFITIQELSREILAAEKRAYGKVIRMMAHEVNNSIGAINSILDSALALDLHALPEWGEDVSHSLRIAIDRNNSLNRFMKNFAEVVRLPAPSLETVTLQELVRKIATLMSYQAENQQISFDFDMPDRDITAKMDSRQMEQALVNIVKNSIESIGESGAIQFRVRRNPTRLVIADNGAGISPGIADKLFSPFFSTKNQGQGVGLTLVREILTNHEVRFSLQTNPEKWTEFKMEFSE